MSEKPKRPITSMFRLPRIPIKNLFKADTQGFVAYSLTKREKSWEAKDATGCQLFWIELEAGHDSGSLAELLGIFGEQIAVLKRESSVSSKYSLAFTNSTDAPEFTSVTLTFQGTPPNRSVSVSLLPKDSNKEITFTWEVTGSNWNLSQNGVSKVHGSFKRTSADKAVINFLQDTLPEEIAVLTFAITFAVYSTSA